MKEKLPKLFKNYTRLVTDVKTELRHIRLGKTSLVDQPDTRRFSLHKFTSLMSLNPSSEWSSSFRKLGDSFRGLALDKHKLISFPMKDEKIQRFRMVEAKTGQPDGLSFEALDRPGHYLRVKDFNLIIGQDNMEITFKKDCTYVPLPSMWFPSFFAFESVSKPSYYIRLTSDEQLQLQRFDGTATFKQEASFQLLSKESAPCLQVGILTWVIQYRLMYDE